MTEAGPRNGTFDQVLLGLALVTSQLDGLEWLRKALRARDVRRAKAEGLAVTMEVTPQHLTLTDACCSGADPTFKVNPPLRAAEDRDALRAGLADGTIDAVGTDHAPHAVEDKEVEFDQAPPGMIGLETALAVNITWLVAAGVISLETLIDKMACAPAKLFHLDGGTFRKGALGDVTVFDPTAAWKVDASAFRTKGRNTPYQGRTLDAKLASYNQDEDYAPTVRQVMRQIYPQARLAPAR